MPVMADITCACGCGQKVSEGKTWVRGHSQRGRGGFDPQRHGLVPAFPPPGSDFDTLAAEAELFGPMIDVDAAASASESPQPDGPPTPSIRVPGPSGPGEDEPPAHARREWRQRTRGRKPKAAPKITTAIHGDIHAKLSFMLEIPGQLWAARDPICGGTFVEQRPAIADALTDIVCESADLVAFFTGPAGGFMRYLNLAVALMPVGQAVMAHHVYHSVELAPEGEPQAEAQYAA